MTLRALTLIQPWAFAIAHGEKKIENRGWPTGFRGPIAIHAGMRKYCKADLEDLALDIARRSGLASRQVIEGARVLGAVVAVADLTAVCSEARYFSHPSVPCACGPWAVGGQHHFQLANVQPLTEPVPAKGALGLWSLPEAVEAAVRAQLTPEVSR